MTTAIKIRTSMAADGDPLQQIDDDDDDDDLRLALGL